MKRIVLSIVVLLVLLCGVAVAEGTTIVASGDCGNRGSNVTWTLDIAGTLTISGEGEMKDYDSWSSYYAPWYSNCESIKAAVIKEGVTTIGATAFFDCSSLSSVTIPAGVTSIGNSAFFNCCSLSSITIPAGVTSIGDDAFFRCSSLTSITIPAGVTGIGNSAFCDCDSLSSIVLPEGVTSIGREAFFRCSSLSSITIPAGVTSIGNVAFYGCSNLSSIKFPAGLASIGEAAFRECSNLSSIKLPAGLVSIGEAAFRECSDLSSITIPDGVTSIGRDAFYKCSSLRRIDISESVTSIGVGAFLDCASQETILFRGYDMPSLGGSVFYDSSTIYCHKGSEVADWAMKNGYTIEYLEDHTHTPVTDPAVPATHVTTGLTEGSHCAICGEVLVEQKIVPIVEVEKLVLPAELEVIEAEAFAGDSFECVVLPEGCKAIGAGAFRNCAQLRFIEIPRSVTSIDGTAFAGCSDSLIIVTGTIGAGEYFARNNGFTCVLR